QFVDFHVVWRINDEEEDEKDKFYPINFLRNVALQGSVAPWVFEIDVDVKPNSDMKSMSRWVFEADLQV
ncbi:hypothetical protein SARC_17561, partial [Sphaeroforma arctica JP610]